MKIVKVIITNFLVLSIISFLSGCGNNVSPNQYAASEVGIASKVVSGLIISKRIVKIDSSNQNGVGTTAGAVAGAAGGSAIGGNIHSNVAAGVGGALLGGILGNAVEKGTNKRQGCEYMIKLKDDSVISIAQAQDLQFEVGQKVLIIYGAMTRIVLDETLSSSELKNK